MLPAPVASNSCYPYDESEGSQKSGSSHARSGKTKQFTDQQLSSSAPRIFGESWNQEAFQPRLRKSSGRGTLAVQDRNLSSFPPENSNTSTPSLPPNLKQRFLKKPTTLLRKIQNQTMLRRRDSETNTFPFPSATLRVFSRGGEFYLYCSARVIMKYDSAHRY